MWSFPKLIVYWLLPITALRPKVDVCFVFLFCGICHHDAVCSPYLKFSLGLFNEEFPDKDRPDEIFRGSVVVGLFDNCRFIGSLLSFAAEDQEPVPGIWVTNWDNQKSIGGCFRAVE
jgi:hypothetical protein